MNGGLRWGLEELKVEGWGGVTIWKGEGEGEEEVGGNRERVDDIGAPEEVLCCTLKMTT